MRSIEFRKFSIIPGGVFGILIVLLSWVTFLDLIPSFWDVLTDYRVIGFLPGLGFIPLIHSAKQKYQIRQYTTVDETSYDSGIVYEEGISYTIPVAGWLHKVHTEVYQSEAFSGDALMGLAWYGDTEGKTYQGGSGNVSHLKESIALWVNADSVQEMTTTYPIHWFFFDATAVDADLGHMERTTKFGGPGRFFEQGELLFVNQAHVEAAGVALTAGIIKTVSVATFIVACLRDRRRDPDEIVPWVYLLFEAMGTTATSFGWPAQSNLRVANLRVVLFAGLDSSTQPYLTIGENASNIDFGGVDVSPSNWLSMETLQTDPTATGLEFLHIATKYSRGPFYLKKGESMQVKMDSISGYGIVEFQYIPDFGYLAEFLRRIEITDLGTSNTSQFMALFTVPYDMYVTSIEGSVSLVGSADFISSLYIMGLKNRNLLDSNDLVVGFVPSKVHGSILGSDTDGGSLPWVIKTIPTVIDVSSSTHFVAKFGESIADYYPAGTLIGVWVPDDFPDDLITLFEIDIHIEALNRIKTTTVGTNFIASSMLVEDNS